MRDWQRKEVRSHKGGITDNVDKSDTEFQEECDNLINGRASQDLETRSGSEYFLNDAMASLQTPTKIRQLFRLEDYIFAYCHADQVSNDPIEGRLYWILEDGTSTAWTEVQTARAQVILGLGDCWGFEMTQAMTEADRPYGLGFRYYRVEAANDVGIVRNPILETIYDESIGTAFEYFQQPSGEGGTSTLKLKPSFMDSGILYTDQFFGTAVSYNVLSAGFNAQGHSISMNETTVGTEPVVLSGSFTDGAKTYAGTIGDYLPLFTKPGHLSTEEWQGHMFLSLEPFDKSFTYNPLDPDALDADTYAPGNDREALKKVYIKWQDQVALPKCTNGQMPKTFIWPEQALPADEDDSRGWRYMDWDLALWRGDAAGIAEAKNTHAHDLVGSKWYNEDTDPMIKLITDDGSADGQAGTIWGPYEISTDRANTTVMNSLIIDIFTSYNDDSGAVTYPMPTIPTAYEFSDNDWVNITSWAHYYYDLSLPFNGLLIVIPSDYLTTEDGSGTDYTTDGNSIIDAINLALTNYNNRPDTFPTYKGEHGPIKYSMGWRNGIVGSTKYLATQWAGGGTNYFWQRDQATADIDGGSVQPMTRGMIKAMFIRPLNYIDGDDPLITFAKTLYKYAAYVREEYTALVEGTPRSFVFDGPAAFRSVGLLSPLTEGRRNNQLRIWTGLTNATTEAPGSLLDLSQMEARVARSKANGDVFYDEIQTKVFFEKDAIRSNTDTPNYGDLEPWVGDEDWALKTDWISKLVSNTSDDNLGFKSEAYFNNGVRTYDALPQGGSYYFTIVNQVGYYANIFGANQRVVQSSPGIPASAPALFFNEFDDPISSLNHFLDKPIIFTPISTWRLEGVRGATGLGRVFQRLVSDEFGSISNASVVRTNVGLFYWSKVGVIFTDGLRATRVSDHLLTRYQKWLSWNLATPDEIGHPYMRGQYNEKDQRVYWSILDENGDPMWVILDLLHGLSSTMPFQTARGHVIRYAEPFTLNKRKKSAFDTDATLYSEKTLRFYRAQDLEILVHDDAFPMDEYNMVEGNFDLGGGITIADEGVMRMPVKPYMKSVGMDYEALGVTKWTHRVIISMKEGNQYGVSIQPLGWNDFGEDPHELGPCLNYQNMEWSADYDALPDPDADLKQFFGHLDVAFRNKHHITFRRRFPKGLVRNIYKQFGFREHPIEMGTVKVPGTEEQPSSITNFIFQPPGGPADRVTFDGVDAGATQTTIRIIQLAATNVHLQTELNWDNAGSILEFTDQSAQVWRWTSLGAGRCPPLTQIVDLGGGFTELRIDMILDGVFRSQLALNGTNVSPNSFFGTVGTMYNSTAQAVWSTNHPLGFITGLPDTALTNNVTVLQLVERHNDGGYTDITVFTSDEADNAVRDLGVDGSGAWYLKTPLNTPLGDKWYQITSMVKAATLLRFQIETDDITTTNAVPIDLVRFAKIPGEQKIGLLDYEVVYSYISDRTKGLFKDPSSGGHNE